jgi:hypothetical protein
MMKKSLQLITQESVIQRALSIPFGAFKFPGRCASPIVSIANGRAKDFPEDLIQGSLYHDYLCVGVSTGFLAVAFSSSKNITIGCHGSAPSHVEKPRSIRKSENL